MKTVTFLLCLQAALANPAQCNSNDDCKSYCTDDYTCNGGFGGDCVTDEDCDSFCFNNAAQTAPYFCRLIKDVEPVNEIASPAKCETDSDCKSYCMNDPTKAPPYSCHGGFQGNCESDDDCQSYCMNDPTKQPPYFCHAIKDMKPPEIAPVFEIAEPAKCETDSDCKSYCMNDPTKTPPYSCHGGFQGDCESDDD